MAQNVWSTGLLCCRTRKLCHYISTLCLRWECGLDLLYDGRHAFPVSSTLQPWVADGRGMNCNSWIQHKSEEADQTKLLLQINQFCSKLHSWSGKKRKPLSKALYTAWIYLCLYMCQQKENKSIKYLWQCLPIYNLWIQSLLNLFQR